MIQNKDLSARISHLLIYLVLTVFALVCILPMIHILAVSFSDSASSGGGLVQFIPIGFNLESYERIIQTGAFVNSMGVSVARTVLGTVLNMILTVLVAYPLSKPAFEFPGRNLFMGMTIFAMLFSGGIIPLFLVVRDLGMLNTIWSLILPGILPIWNVILLMNFFREVPRELEEAAVVDGASQWQILWRIYLPLSLPALATLMLFAAVGHWNAWFDGLIYMRPDNYPLQTFLRTVVINMDSSVLMRDASQIARVSDRSLRAAQIFVTTLPILLVYPFLQRYFVAGIRIGAVKG